MLGGGDAMQATWQALSKPLPLPQPFYIGLCHSGPFSDASPLFSEGRGHECSPFRMMSDLRHLFLQIRLDILEKFQSHFQTIQTRSPGNEAIPKCSPVHLPVPIGKWRIRRKPVRQRNTAQLHYQSPPSAPSKIRLSILLQVCLAGSLSLAVYLAITLLGRLSVCPPLRPPVWQRCANGRRPENDTPYQWRSQTPGQTCSQDDKHNDWLVNVAVAGPLTRSHPHRVKGGLAGLESPWNPRAVLQVLKATPKTTISWTLLHAMSVLLLGDEKQSRNCPER